jgi:hypothetical protein
MPQSRPAVVNPHAGTKSAQGTSKTHIVQESLADAICVVEFALLCYNLLKRP